jgi:putative membrane protein
VEVSPVVVGLEEALVAAAVALAAAAPRVVGREGRMPHLREAGRTKVEDSISRAEKKTSGEIVVVVTNASDHYSGIGLMWAALTALSIPLPLILFTNWPVEHIYVVQLAIFALGVALLQWKPLRFAVVPKWMKHARAHKRAVEEFLAQNLHTTKGRTGILIYVSLAEHFAELIADHAIDKKVTQETWDQIVRELTDRLSRGELEKGLIHSIEACGKLLAKHFPPGSEDPNELPNHLIVRDVR